MAANQFKNKGRKTTSALPFQMLSVYRFQESSMVIKKIKKARSCSSIKDHQSPENEKTPRKEDENFWKTETAWELSTLKGLALMLRARGFRVFNFRAVNGEGKQKNTSG